MNRVRNALTWLITTQIEWTIQWGVVCIGGIPILPLLDIRLRIVRDR